MQAEHDPGHREAPAPFMCPTCQAHFATITECDAHVREAHPKPPEMTADEAIAIVDGWGPEQQFGLHRIARTLRQHASLMEGNRDIWANEAIALAALVASAVFATKRARPPIAEGAQPHPWYGPCDSLGPDGQCEAEPSAEDMERARRLLGAAPVGASDGATYIVRSPSIDEIAAALAAVRREALEQAAQVATREEDACRAELDHDSGNVASNIADAIRALIAAPAPHTGPVPHAIAWKREWLDIAERLDRLADHAERQANDRVTALVAGWARQLRNLLYADVNGGLEDEYMDYPDPPDRTAPHTDGEGG